MNRLRMAALLLVLLLTVTCGAVAGADDGFFFVQLTDPQMGFTNSNKDVLPEIEHLTKAVEHINRLKPAFVLISGDMTHAVRDPKQTREFWGIAREIRPEVPLRFVPGNHDVGKSKAEDVRGYQRIYGKDHYSFSYGGSEFIVLNSPLISDNSDKDLRDAQRSWLETELAAAKAKHARHIFVCTHQPWFLETPNEADKYQNVPLAYRGAYLDLMDRFGVDYCLSGHLHHTQEGAYHGVKLVTGGALSKSIAKPPVVGLNIVKVYKDRVEHKFYGFDEVPHQVRM